MRNAEYDLCAAAGTALHGKSVVGAIVKPDAVIDILHGVAAVRGLYRVAEKLCDLLRRHSAAVVRDDQKNVVCGLLCCDFDDTAARPGLKAVRDRIFQDRLQRQTQDRIVHQRIGNLDGIGERVMKASLHDVQIAFRDLQLLPQRDDQTALAQNAAIEVGKVVDQICGLLPVIKLDQRADIVQRIIQEMRVDLLVQQLMLKRLSILRELKIQSPLPNVNKYLAGALL